MTLLGFKSVLRFINLSPQRVGGCRTAKNAVDPHGHLEVCVRRTSDMWQRDPPEPPRVRGSVYRNRRSVDGAIVELDVRDTRPWHPRHQPSGLRIETCAPSRSAELFLLAAITCARVDHRNDTPRFMCAPFSQNSSGLVREQNLGGEHRSVRPRVSLRREIVQRYVEIGVRPRVPITPAKDGAHHDAYRERGRPHRARGASTGRQTTVTL